MRVFGRPIEVKAAIDWAKLRNNQHLTYAVQTDPNDKDRYGWCLFMGKPETVHAKLSERRKEHPEHHDGIYRFAFQDMVKWAQDAGLYPMDAVEAGGTGSVAEEPQDDDIAQTLADHKASKEDYREEAKPVVVTQEAREAPKAPTEPFKPQGKVVTPATTEKGLQELLEAAARDAYWSGYRTGQLAERYQRHGRI